MNEREKELADAERRIERIATVREIFDAGFTAGYSRAGLTTNTEASWEDFLDNFMLRSRAKRHVTNEEFIASAKRMLEKYRVQLEQFTETSENMETEVLIQRLRLAARVCIDNAVSNAITVSAEELRRMAQLYLDAVQALTSKS